MRILLLSNLYRPHTLGGAEIVASDIVTELENRGHEVFVLTSSYGLSGPQQEGNFWRTLNIAPPVHFDQHHPIWQQLHQLSNYYRRYHCSANAKELCRMINITRPEVLLICEITGIGVISLLKVLYEVKIPIVFYLQSYLLLYARSPETDQSHLRARWLKKLLIGSLPAPTFTSLIAVSNAVKQEYVKGGYDPESIEVIYNGVDSRFLKPLLPKNIEDRKDIDTLGTEKKDIELLYVGRLTTEKGILILLKALDLLVNEQGRQNLHLNIFGDGDKAYFNELQSFIQDKQLTNIISFRGRIPQDELIEYYDRSDMMIMPSIWQEPFALVTAEAMARGLPVIASDVGGTGERIIHNVNGLLVKPGDERALASAIRELVENPDKHERLSQGARATIFEHFTVEKCTDRVEQHLQRAISKTLRVDTNK